MEKQPEITLLVEILHGELHKRRVEFTQKRRNLDAECAAKGLRGGPHIDGTFNLCIREGDERLELLISTIRRSILDTTYEVSADEIVEAFDAVLPLDTDLISAIEGAIRVSGAALASGHTAALRDEIARRLKAKRAELEFFAKAPRRARSQSMTFQGDTANIQSGGVANVTQYIGRSNEVLRNDGALAQVEGLLDLVERRLDDALKENTSLTVGSVTALEPIFKVAYSFDVSTAATSAGVNVGHLYHHLSNIQRDCIELGKLHEEVVQFNAEVQRGNYYQTSEERREGFVRRRDAGIESIRGSITGARAALNRSDATTPTEEATSG
jgi:hypothetical protein